MKGVYCLIRSELKQIVYKPEVLNDKNEIKVLAYYALNLNVTLTPEVANELTEIMKQQGSDFELTLKLIPEPPSPQMTIEGTEGVKVKAE